MHSACVGSSGEPAPVGASNPPGSVCASTRSWAAFNREIRAHEMAAPATFTWERKWEPVPLSEAAARFIVLGSASVGLQGWENRQVGEWWWLALQARDNWFEHGCARRGGENPIPSAGGAGGQRCMLRARPQQMYYWDTTSTSSAPSESAVSASTLNSRWCPPGRR